MIKKYSYLLFDLDGTITDSCEGIYKSFAYALDCYGIHVDSLESLRPVVGPPLKESFMTMFGLDEKKADDAVAKYRERYTETGIYENRVYDGAEQMLSKLKNAGYKIALATSKPEFFARRILEYFHLDGYFDYITGATFDGKIKEKEDVILHILSVLDIKDRKTALMIGDRKHDLIGAQKLGLDAMGVLYGYGSREELGEYPHIYLADTPGDVTNYILHGGNIEHYGGEK